MKDYITVKITKIACKFAVKSDQGLKTFLGIIKKRERLQQSTFDRVLTYQDFTLHLSCRPKLYYRDAGCKL